MSVLDGNAQKTPLAQSLQKLGRAKAQDAVAALGLGIPCTIAKVVGPGVVTVNFEVAPVPAALPQVTMPVSKFSYIRYPLKVGDVGVALSSTTRTGALTGLGLGTPNLKHTVGNLAAMTFFPLGTTQEAFVDPEALDLFGNILCTPDKLAFFATAKVVQQEVTGPLSMVTDSAAKAVLTSIVAALVAYGLVTDGTT